MKTFKKYFTEDNRWEKMFTFGFDEASEKMETYLMDLQGKYQSPEDFKLHYGYGDDIPNAITVFNKEMLTDKEFKRIIHFADGQGDFDEGEVGEPMDFFDKHEGEEDDDWF